VLSTADRTNIRSMGFEIQPVTSNPPVDETEAVQDATTFPGLSGGSVDRIQLATMSTSTGPVANGQPVWVMSVTPRAGALQTGAKPMDPAFYYVIINAVTGDRIEAFAANRPSAATAQTAAHRSRS